MIILLEKTFVENLKLGRPEKYRETGSIYAYVGVFFTSGAVGILLYMAVRYIMTEGGMT